MRRRPASAEGLQRNSHSDSLQTQVDLRGWKLTLPVGKPDEIRDLDGFRSEHFERTPEGLRFRAPVEGVTTKGSSYPRCELRELGAWSTESGTHTMAITQAITRTPSKKPHVVAGQIHDAADDVVMVRLEGRKLFVEGGGKDLGMLDPAYALGTFFDVTILATGGRVRVSYNGTEMVDVERPARGCYFKAGVYTQSNPEKGDAPGELGEVVLRALAVRHA